MERPTDRPTATTQRNGDLIRMSRRTPTRCAGREGGREGAKTPSDVMLLAIMQGGVSADSVPLEQAKCEGRRGGGGEISWHRGREVGHTAIFVSARRYHRQWKSNRTSEGGREGGREGGEGKSLPPRRWWGSSQPTAPKSQRHADKSHRIADPIRRDLWRHYCWKFGMSAARARCVRRAPSLTSG